jgi:microcystin-dependent protein
MSDIFLGEIRMFGFNFAPVQWALCNGALLPVTQNQALFALLGTTYGGNGMTNFALPDLQGRTPLDFGTAPDGSSFTMGQKGGVETVTLQTSQMAAHNHLVNASITPGNAPSAASGTALIASVATQGVNFYGPASTLVSLAPQSVGPAGANVPHNNQQPYLVMNYCISTIGVFPSRS